MGVSELFSIHKNSHICAITVTPTEMTLTVGGATGTAIATVSPAEATNKSVIWSSSDNNVATVSNGVVTPLSAGKVTITATSVADETKKGTCVVTVQAAPVVPAETESIVTRNPGNTGGASAEFNSDTNTFSGTIAYYEATAEGFPPVAGNYVGVQIMAPADVTVDTTNATFTYTNASGVETTLTGTWLDGDNFVYYYPLVSAERKSFTVVIDWDGSGAAYAEEIITINIAADTTLDASVTPAMQIPDWVTYNVPKNGANYLGVQVRWESIFEE